MITKLVLSCESLVSLLTPLLLCPHPLTSGFPKMVLVMAVFQMGVLVLCVGGMLLRLVLFCVDGRIAMVYLTHATTGNVSILCSSSHEYHLAGFEEVYCLQNKGSLVRHFYAEWFKTCLTTQRPHIYIYYYEDS